MCIEKFISSEMVDNVADQGGEEPDVGAQQTLLGECLNILM
jgi:hypothetical protein